MPSKQALAASPEAYSQLGQTEREGSSDGGGKGFGDSSGATSEKEGAEEGLLDKWYELRRIQSGEAGLWGPARRVS